jgi:transglutaminase-like putative cysteine protease
MKNFPEPANPARWWDWSAALLLLAAMLTAATRLVATHWTEELPLIQTVTILGTIAGLALGQSRFSPTVARFFAIAYGLFVIPWQLGGTLEENLAWPDRLPVLSNRLLITLDQLLQQKPVTDNMFFLFLMSTLYWSMSAYAGYTLTRHARPWPLILPAGLAVIIIHAYDSFFPVRTWFLAGYIFLSLLLLARIHFLTLQNRWRRNGTYLPPFIGLDSIRMGLLTTAILVLFAWTAPALASTFSPAESAWRKVATPWLAVRDRLSNAFSSLQASVGVVTDFYGDTLPLGRGNPLADTVIMNVVSPPRVAAGVRYYWRQRVYDTYDGGWASTLPMNVPVSPDNFDLDQPEFEGRALASFRIKTEYPIQSLYTPSQPIWVSRPVQAEIALNSDGTADLGLIRADPYLRAGEEYEVQASLSAASIEELRGAGSDYPSWVTDRYLQLPENITPRTQELAEQITAGLDNPYDQAEAITKFLRSNITYQDTVPNPPSGQEPIDWFLFDYGRGFCNYYATAEIILLRSLGIPARMAVGYAEGQRTVLEPFLAVPQQGASVDAPQELSSPGDLYTVRHRDAHAWPEVFFPGLGWVEFEPTVSQLPILRPRDAELNLEDPEASTSTENAAQANQESLDQLLARERANQLGAAAETGLRIPTIVLVLIGLAAAALLLVFLSQERRKRGLPPIPVKLEAGLRRVGIEPPNLLRRWVRYASLAPLAKAYLELNRALSRLGNPAEPKDTPAERAAHLGEILPSAVMPIQTLLFEYQAVTYGQKAGDQETAREAGNEIRKLSFLALGKRILARFQQPARRSRPLYRR